MSCPCSNNIPYTTKPVPSSNSITKSSAVNSQPSALRMRTCKCTPRPRSNSASSVNERNPGQDNGSGSLTAPCRCSKICYRTSSHEGCTDEQPGSGRRRSSDRKDNGRRQSDTKDNASGSLSNPCRCSRICYRTKSHQGCTSLDPTMNNGRPGGDLKSNGSSSVNSCRCSHVSRRAANQYGCRCKDFGDNSRTSSSSSTRRSRSASLDSCHCGNYGTHQNVPRSFVPTPNNQFSNKPYGTGCLCYNLTNELPVKEPKNTGSDITDCLCNGNSFPNDQMSAFSLDSMDLKYLEQVRLLTQQDYKLKQELENLAAQEVAIRNTIKQSDQPPSSVPFGPQSGPNDSKASTNNIRMLRALNKELHALNETLCDRIQDLRLERDQLAQKIEGPLSRELERIRKQYVQLQAEISVKSHPDYVETTSDELNLMKSQLARTQENIGDMALVNEGIKQEVVVLEFKCGQMEQVLIKQKVDEIDAINKLQTGINDINCSTQSSSVDTSCSCNDVP